MLSNFGAPKFDSVTNTSSTRTQRAWRAGRAVLRRALPQACVLCTAHSGDALLCTSCRVDMPRAGNACPRCALPSVESVACGACLKQPPPYATTIAAWRYAFPADRLLQAFKYGAQLALCDTFARAVVDAVAMQHAVLPDRIAAVPLAAARQRQRGFNHAQEIARVVSSLTGLPLFTGLRRIRDSPPQAGLSRVARAQNVRRAFACAATIEGSTVAIIDDVMTTGATLAAAAVALHEAGAGRVDAWIVARTPPPSRSQPARP